MVGYSKCSQVKHIEGPQDGKRGAAFRKAVKAITVAGRLADGGLSGNPGWRAVVKAARSQRMSEEDMGCATRRRTDKIEGIHDEETFYEGRTPGRIGLAIKAMTAPENRTAVKFQSIYRKNHGNRAASPRVSSMFHRKGTFDVPEETLAWLSA